MFLKKENLKRCLNKKVILGLSWKYICLLFILLGIGGLLVLGFVYKKDSRFEAIKIFISITSVVMTFIVFLRGFEVFEETKKSNQEESVNKNFYAMLSLFQQKQKFLYSEKSLDKKTGDEKLLINFFRFGEDNSILLSREDNRNILEIEKQYFVPYFNAIKSLLRYLENSLYEGKIDSTMYTMYLNIITSQLSENEMQSIIIYSLYTEEGFDLGQTLIGKGLFDDVLILSTDIFNGLDLKAKQCINDYFSFESDSHKLEKMKKEFKTLK